MVSSPIDHDRKPVSSERDRDSFVGDEANVRNMSTFFIE